MLRKVRNVLILFAILSLAVIILSYLTNSKVKAPHPDGNFTALDMSFIYGDISMYMSSIMPYAVGILFIATVGVIVVTNKIKSY